MAAGGRDRGLAVQAVRTQSCWRSQGRAARQALQVLRCGAHAAHGAQPAVGPAGTGGNAPRWWGADTLPCLVSGPLVQQAHRGPRSLRASQVAFVFDGYCMPRKPTHSADVLEGVQWRAVACRAVPGRRPQGAGDGHQAPRWQRRDTTARVIPV